MGRCSSRTRFSPRRQSCASALRSANRRADPRTCLLSSIWLQSGTLGQGGLFNQEVSAQIGVGPAGAPTSPLAGAANLGQSGPNAVSGYISSGFQLTIDIMGAFFQSNAGVGYVDTQYQAQMNNLTGGTLAAQTFILLHELGHIFKAPGFQDDATADGQAIGPAQKSNNDLIWQHCGATIAAAGGGPAPPSKWSFHELACVSCCRAIKRTSYRGQLGTEDANHCGIGYHAIQGSLYRRSETS